MFNAFRIAILSTAILGPLSAYAQTVGDEASLVETIDTSPTINLPSSQDIADAGSRQSAADDGTLVAPTLNLLIFMSLFFLGVYVLYRWLKKKKLRDAGQIDGESGIVRVISSSSLSGNKTIRLLDLDTKILVIGVTDHTISTLASVEDPQEMARLRLEASRENKAIHQSGFAASLKDMFVSKSAGIVPNQGLGSGLLTGLGGRLKRFSKPK